MLSSLKPSPLFIWSEPINAEAFFHLAFKIRIGHIFHCQPFSFALKDKNGPAEIRAKPDPASNAGTEAHAWYFFFFWESIVKRICPVDIKIFSRLKLLTDSSCLVGLVIHLRLPRWSNGTWEAGSVLSRDNMNLQWITCSPVLLILKILGAWIHGVRNILRQWSREMSFFSDKQILRRSCAMKINYWLELMEKCLLLLWSFMKKKNLKLYSTNEVKNNVCIAKSSHKVSAVCVLPVYDII